MGNKILSVLSYLFFFAGFCGILGTFFASIFGFCGGDLPWSWEALMVQLWICVGLLLLSLLLSWFFGSIKFN
jgi:hypothetical protein